MHYIVEPKIHWESSSTKPPRPYSYTSSAHCWYHFGSGRHLLCANWSRWHCGISVKWQIKSLATHQAKYEESSGTGIYSRHPALQHYTTLMMSKVPPLANQFQKDSFSHIQAGFLYVCFSVNIYLQYCGAFLEMIQIITLREASTKRGIIPFCFTKVKSQTQYSRELHLKRKVLTNPGQCTKIWSFFQHSGEVLRCKLEQRGFTQSFS